LRKVRVSTFVQKVLRNCEVAPKCAPKWAWRRAHDEGSSAVKKLQLVRIATAAASIAALAATLGAGYKWG